MSLCWFCCPGGPGPLWPQRELPSSTGWMDRAVPHEGVPEAAPQVLRELGCASSSPQETSQIHSGPLLSASPADWKGLCFLSRIPVNYTL